MTAFKRLAALFVFLLPALSVATPTLGPQRVIALSVQFANQKVPGYALDRVRAAALESLKIVEDSSGGKWRVGSFEVAAGRTTLTAKDGCQHRKWATEGVAALGKSTADYDLIILVGGDGCPRGLGGGNIAYAYQPAPMQIVHEIGHTLGFGHSPGSEGTEYGNPSNAMGGSYPVPFGSFHRAYAKWLDDSQIVGNGRHMIAALGAGGVQAVRTESASTLSGLFAQLPATAFVEYRAGTGFDARLQDGYRDRVIVHSLHLGKWVRRAVLSEGQTHYDPVRNLFVRVHGINADGADVEVYGYRSACALQKPTITIDGASATIRNNNDQTCAPALLRTTGPLSDPSPVVASGESVTIPLVDASGRVCVSAGLNSSGSTWGNACATLADVQPPAAPEPTPEPAPEPIPDQPDPCPCPDVPAAPVEAGSATILAAADTYLYSVHRTKSLGSADRLLASANHYPLIRFNVFASQGGPVPDGATITRATLRLYKTVWYDSTLALYPVAGPWSESTTFNGSPGWRVEPVATVAPGRVGWVPIDVTDSVRDAPHGWHVGRVAGGYSGGSSVTFASREAGADLAPHLVVEWR